MLHVYNELHLHAYEHTHTLSTMSHDLQMAEFKWSTQHKRQKTSALESICIEHNWFRSDASGIDAGVRIYVFCQRAC